MTKDRPEFIPQQQNANLHSQRGQWMLEHSMEEDGFLAPITVANDGEAIDGSLRMETSFSMFTDADPIVVESNGDRPIIHVRTDIPNAKTDQAKRLSLSANRTAQVSLTWNAPVLKEWASEGITDAYWLPDEIKPWEPDEAPLVSEPEDEENTADALDKAEKGEIDSRVKFGEIWKLGRHYMACGDSTDEANVRALLGDRFGAVGMVWADPPYGISIVGKSGSLGGGTKSRYTPILGDENADVAYASFGLCTNLWSCPQVFWGANHYAEAITDSSCWVVWDKQDGKTVDFADCELAWTNIQQPARIFKHIWDGFRKDSEKGEKRTHPTQKPIALCEWVFEKYGKPLDIIFDPFLGSAPSIIASQKMGDDRTVYGFELLPQYCEVICQRFENFTGVNAELVGRLPQGNN